MKIVKAFLITTLVMAVVAVAAVFLLSRSGETTQERNEQIVEVQRDDGEEKAYRYDIDKTAVKLQTSGEEKNVLNFNTKKINVETSQKAAERLERLINRTQTTPEAPIIAANPFGTNENSFYFYFETGYRAMVRYTVTVEKEEIPDFVRYVSSGQPDNLSTVHEFTVSGMVPGMKNYLIMEILDSTGAKRESVTYSFSVPKTGAKTVIGVQKGRSEEKSTLGLYFVFPENKNNILAYDNSGILRNTVNTECGHGKRMYTTGDSLIYQISDTGAVRVSPTGQVLAMTEIKGYGEIRDFVYDGYDNIYALVRKKGRDYLVSASFETGKNRRVYAFPKGVRTESLTPPDGGGLFVASSVPNGIIKIGALTGNTPKAVRVFGKKSDWEKTTLRKKVKQDKILSKWNMSGVVLMQDEKDKNTFSAYLSDGGKGTAVEFSIEKNGIQKKRSYPTDEKGNGISQCYNGHTVITEADKGTFAEYARDGKVIRQFDTGIKLASVIKCSLNGMCFYAG